MKTSLIFSFFLAAALTGCTTSKLAYDFDRDVDFGNYGSFDWYDEQSPESSDHQLGKTFIEKRFRRALKDELTSIGYRHDTDSPDLLVYFHTRVKDKEEVSCMFFDHDYFGHHGRGRYSHSSFPFRHSCTTYGYSEATLIIDFIDAKTNELLWRGWHPKQIFGPTISEEVIQDAVGQILANFPPPT